MRVETAIKIANQAQSYWDYVDKTHNYTSYGFMTLSEVAKELGITRERVRQIETKALNKLRHPNLNKIIKSFAMS